MKKIFIMKFLPTPISIDKYPSYLLYIVMLYMSILNTIMQVFRRNLIKKVKSTWIHVCNQGLPLFGILGISALVKKNNRLGGKKINLFKSFIPKEMQWMFAIHTKQQVKYSY